MTRADMLAEIARRRTQLKNTPDGETKNGFLALLDGLEPRLRNGEVSAEDWEQFEFHWRANLADVQRVVARNTAFIVLFLEERERMDPAAFAGDTKLHNLLNQWRNEGFKEEFLGSITLEERRDLEEQARRWREGE